MGISPEAGAALIFVIMLALAVPYSIRSYLSNKFNSCIKRGFYEDAISLINKPLFRYVFSKYDCSINTLRCLLAIDDYKGITQFTTKLLNSSLKPNQQYEIASLTYYYFIGQENKEMCEKLLTLLEFKESDDRMEYNRIIYRIVIEKRSDDIEKISQLIDKNPECGILYYIQGLQYINMGNIKQAKRYLGHAKNDLKGTPYHKKVKAILDTI